jgi:hypothetical protein
MPRSPSIFRETYSGNLLDKGIPLGVYFCSLTFFDIAQKGTFASW